MAKGKRAAALFEVIHRDVRYASPRRRQSPVAWLKDRIAHAPGLGATSHAAAASGGVATIDHDPTLRPHPMLGTAPASAATGLGMTQLEPGDRLMAAAGSSMSPASSLHSTPAKPPFMLDRDRQVIRLRLTYTSAAIGAFAVLVALTLAFIVGRGGPATPEVPQNGQTSEQIRAGAVTPGALDIDPAGDQGGLANRMTPAPGAPAPEKPAGRPLPPPPTPTTRGDRIVGMNYVIVQSYPDEKEAQAAIEVLRQHGVSASVVKGTAYAPRWYSVVGLEPFDHIKSNDEYQQYLKRLAQISDKFAGNSKFKKFEPRPYKWQNH